MSKPSTFYKRHNLVEYHYGQSIETQEFYRCRKCGQEKRGGFMCQDNRKQDGVGDICLDCEDE